MNIDEILKELKQLEISKDEFYVEENAALVIRGIIPNTDNIKVCMSSDAIKTLENTYKLTTKDSKHYMFGKLYIRECKKSCFDMEECEPYNIESICKRLYILLESSNESELIKKIKEYVGPSFLYVNNIEEYEREKKNGANLEEIDSRGETPLFRAVRNDNIALVSRMLDDGANINALNSKGCNLGFFCNSLDMIKLLIEKGLKYNTRRKSKMKIIVIGCPGSGKSTFSQRLNDVLNIPLFHLDMLYHNSDGTHISKEELEEKLKKIFKENDEWIIDGNYQRTLEMRMKECDTIFLLDYPIEVCLAGAESRVGKKRDDLPWVEEKLDDEFKQVILNFSKEKLPQIYGLIEKYKDDKKIVIFKSREEAESYICQEV